MQRRGPRRCATIGDSTGERVTYETDVPFDKTAECMKCGRLGARLRVVRGMLGGSIAIAVCDQCIASFILVEGGE